jgi:TadE-like protein
MTVKTPVSSAVSRQRGQSLVEFAVSSVVLLLLVGGLVDVGRSIFVSEALSNAAREGARHGAWFDAPSVTHPYLFDAEIKSVVDAELATIGLPASVLKSPNCPNPTDTNSFHNPPYVSTAYPSTAGDVWLYICYNNGSAPTNDYPSSPPTVPVVGWDLNVIVLYAYGPLTPLVKTQFGIFQVAANEHITVQGR